MYTQIHKYFIDNVIAVGAFTMPIWGYNMNEVLQAIVSLLGAVYLTIQIYFLIKKGKDK